MLPKKQNFGLVSIASPNHLEKPPLERGGITPSSCPHQTKTLLEENF